MSITLKKTMMKDGIPYLLNEETMTYYPTIKQDKETGLTYTLDPQTFVYLPNLTAGENEEDEVIIGRWGLKRKKYLMEHRNWIYLEMADNHTLTAHLTEIDKEADSLMETLTEEMMKKEGVTEKLKADDQMEWVRRANSIQNRAEEIVLNQLIYA